MTARLASLPMYLANRPAVATLWELLRHSLGAWLQQKGVDTDFDVQRRAQEVSVAEFVALAKHCQGQ